MAVMFNAKIFPGQVRKNGMIVPLQDRLTMYRSETMCRKAYPNIGHKVYDVKIKKNKDQLPVSGSVPTNKPRYRTFNRYKMFNSLLPKIDESTNEKFSVQFDQFEVSETMVDKQEVAVVEDVDEEILDKLFNDLLDQVATQYKELNLEF